MVRGSSHAYFVPDCTDSQTALDKFYKWYDKRHRGEQIEVTSVQQKPCFIIKYRVIG